MADRYVGDNFNSPGAAGFNSVNNFLLQQHQQESADILRKIEMEREARLARSEDLDMVMKQKQLELQAEGVRNAREDRAAARDEKKVETARKQREDDISAFQKNVLDKKAPGDYFTPEEQQEAKRLGVSLAVSPNGQAVVPAGGGAATLPTAPIPGMGDLASASSGMPGQGEPPSAAVQPAPTALPGAQPAEALPITGGAYLGTPAHRQEMLDHETIRKMIADPKTPDGAKRYLQMRIALPKGENPPAELFKPEKEVKPVDEMQDVYSFNSRTGALEKTGEVKKGSVIRAETPSNDKPSSESSGTLTPFTIYGEDGKPTKTVMINNKSGRTQPVMDAQGHPMDVTNKPGPQLTSSTRTMMEGAKTLRPHITQLDEMAQELEKRGLFGPVMSRVRNLAAKVGTTGAPEDVQKEYEGLDMQLRNDPELNNDRLVGRFTSMLGFMASGAGRVHGGARGGGSIQMIDYMKNLLTSSSSINMFLGRLDTLNDLLAKYEAGPDAVGKEAPAAKETQPPAGAATAPAPKKKNLTYNPKTGQLE